MLSHSELVFKSEQCETKTAAFHVEYIVATSSIPFREISHDLVTKIVWNLCKSAVIVIGRDVMLERDDDSVHDKKSKLLTMPGFRQFWDQNKADYFQVTWYYKTKIGTCFCIQ